MLTPRSRPKPTPAPTYDDLLHEVARLKKLFAPPEIRWAGLFGFSRTQARLVWVLVNHDVVTHEALHFAVSHDQEESETDWIVVVRSQIQLLRGKLRERFNRRDCIASIQRVGYVMAEDVRRTLRDEIARIDEIVNQAKGV